MFLAVMVVVGLVGVMAAWGSIVNAGVQDRLGPSPHLRRAGLAWTSYDSAPST